MKKVLFSFVLLLCFVLAGCGAAEPTDVVNNFMKAVQNDDWEKALTYIEPESWETNLSDLGNEDEEFTKKIFSAISKSVEYKSVEEKSIDGDNATVTMNVTSIDFSAVATSTMSEVMPIAFGLAFSDDKAAADKQIKELTETTILKNLTAEDATLATRDVTINLKKSEDGDYLIVADENLIDVLLANANKLGSFFGDQE